MVSTNMEGVQQMQDFVNEQWASGLHREITVRYSNVGMFVTLDFSNRPDTIPVIYVFTWEGE